jgi:hypothetical protein
LKWELKTSDLLVVSTLFSKNVAEQHFDFKNMKNQSEHDRVDLRTIQTQLKEMTKDRDNCKEKFNEMYEKLNETENILVQTRYDYDELFSRYLYISKEYERATMESEDYRSVLYNYNEKFKRIAAWEKELKQMEKELRAIKKRDNPYEYVDFSDQYVQTSNPTKDKGVTTDKMVIAVPAKGAYSNMRSSFADSVTTVLGGIPAATETVTDIDMISPKEQIYYKHKLKNPFQIKSRPQSSQVMGSTYSYNIKNGTIEEEDDPLGMNGFKTKTKDLYRTTSSIGIGKFQSPSGIRPTALQRHQKEFKTHYGADKIMEPGYSNIFEERAKTAVTTKNKHERRNVHTNLKSVYVNPSKNKRPMTEKPGARKKNVKITHRTEESLHHNKSRPVSQGATMSKTGTQISTNHQTFVTRCKSSLRNLIKSASTRNHK